MLSPRLGLPHLGLGVGLRSVHFPYLLQQRPGRLRPADGFYFGDRTVKSVRNRVNSNSLRIDTGEVEQAAEGNTDAAAGIMGG